MIEVLFLVLLVRPAPASVCDQVDDWARVRVSLRDVDGACLLGPEIGVARVGGRFLLARCP